MLFLSLLLILMCHFSHSIQNKVFGEFQANIQEVKYYSKFLMLVYFPFSVSRKTRQKGSNYILHFLMNECEKVIGNFMKWIKEPRVNLSATLEWNAQQKGTQARWLTVQLQAPLNYGGTSGSDFFRPRDFCQP